MNTGDRLLTPGEVAALFRVDPKTVTRWAAAGRLSSIRTPGGHRRFREAEVRALLEGEVAIEPADQPAADGRATGSVVESEQPNTPPSSAAQASAPYGPKNVLHFPARWVG